MQTPTRMDTRRPLRDRIQGQKETRRWCDSVKGAAEEALALGALAPKADMGTQRPQQFHERTTTLTDARWRTRLWCLLPCVLSLQRRRGRQCVSRGQPHLDNDIEGAAGVWPGAICYITTMYEQPACSPEPSPLPRTPGRRLEPDHIHVVIKYSCTQASRRKPTSKAPPPATTTPRRTKSWQFVFFNGTPAYLMSVYLSFHLSLQRAMTHNAPRWMTHTLSPRQRHHAANIRRAKGKPRKRP